MLQCYTNKKDSAIPIEIILKETFSSWLSKQNELTKNWLQQVQFKADPGCAQIIPDANGKIGKVVSCLTSFTNLWNLGHLPLSLPEGHYALCCEEADISLLAIGWGLGAYQFSKYKKPLRQSAQLFLPENLQVVNDIVHSIYQVRDLINIPTDDMGPTEFALIAEQLAKKYHAQFSQLIGDELLANNYAAIHTVGRASDDPPRLLDFRWGNPSHPKITLVGKGVCFDSGGLDIKPAPYMQLMKKDMGGAAHVLGLAQLIMQANLPVRLRVIIPIVENVISGNAYRPGDIIKSRKGLTIEVGNTDAEGRLILADALAEAASENPQLLIDIATLTGAARIALGTDLPAVFSNNDEVVHSLIQHGEKILDPMWRLPLFTPYREYLNTPFADINNNSPEPYAGAITAALFLKDFVPDEIPWLHFDMMAWNLRPRPGRPQGGEAMVLRALFSYLSEKFQD